MQRTHIAQVLHVAYKIALDIDDLVDHLLPRLLLIRHAIHDLLGHCMYPEQAWFHVVQVTKALTAQLTLDAEPRQRFHVQTTLLFKPRNVAVCGLMI